MDVLEEVKANTNSGVSVSSNLANNAATTNSVLNSILKRARSKSSLNLRTFSFKERRLKSDSINVPNKYVCQSLFDMSSGSIR